jgi:hypothetical protein
MLIAHYDSKGSQHIEINPFTDLDEFIRENCTATSVKLIKSPALRRPDRCRMPTEARRRTIDKGLLN